MKVTKARALSTLALIYLIGCDSASEKLESAIDTQSPVLSEVAASAADNPLSPESVSAGELNNMKLYVSRSELPLCNGTLKNHMGYVADEKSLFICNGTSWSIADLGGGETTKTLTELDVLAIGDRTCPAGGLIVKVGTDSNGDGVLSANELSKAQSACNSPAIVGTYRHSVNNYMNAINLTPSLARFVYIGEVRIVQYSDGSYFVTVSGINFDLDSGDDLSSHDFSYTFRMAPSNSNIRFESFKFDSHSDLIIYFGLDTSTGKPIFTALIDDDGDFDNDTTGIYVLQKD